VGERKSKDVKAGEWQVIIEIVRDPKEKKKRIRSEWANLGEGTEVESPESGAKRKESP